MKIIIEIPHPARVHLFRNLYFKLIKENNEVIVLYKDKEQTRSLLNIYKIPGIKIGSNKKGFLSKLIGLFFEFFNVFKISYSFKPDLFLGGASPVIGLCSFIFRSKYISFSDTEHAKLTWFLSKIFIDIIITPKCFLKNLGDKHIRIDGYKELAYLYPKYFKPDTSVLKDLNLSKNDKIIILRFISWEAIHDIGHNGFSNNNKYEAVKMLSKYGKVFISSESRLPKDLEELRLNISPEKIHSLIYFSSLFFGESGTMATEAAILGTPSVRVSSLSKLLGNFKELNEKYGLIYYYDNFQDGLNKSINILKNKNSKIKWIKKSNELYNDKIDVTDFIFNKILE
tara:strand:- start:9849 stop:10871 length:1023 start_codon:yes stop_codon:yes gene_type:complete